MNSESVKSCCASLCTIVSAVAIPVLVYIALLCGAGSRLIEIPQEKKTSAAVGCWVAAALYEPEKILSHLHRRYVATFFVSYNFKARKALENARLNSEGYQLQPM
jgi:hypothetical protein